MRRLVPQAIVILIALLVAALLPGPDRPASADTAELARQTGLRVLGATRGYATTALWLRAGDAYRRGDFYETLASYQLIAELQPRNPAVYSYLAWNQAYNISAPFTEHDQRLQWVVRGLQTLHQGQQRMPIEPSLRMDEWNFLLDRTISYPVGLLRAERDRYSDNDPDWAEAADRAIEQAEALNAEQTRSLHEFLREYGLQFGIYAENPEDWQGEAVRALGRLDEQTQTMLAAAHWCRLQAMLMVLRPALEMRPHSFALDIAVILTCRMALLAAGHPNLGALDLRKSRVDEYAKGVASALRAGIENARRAGGEEAVAAFLEHARENLSDVPELASGLTELNE
jgi:hypothetical protein